MNTTFLHAVVGTVLFVTMLSADDQKSLPDKLATLKFNYEAAIVRATTPITQTYIQQLQKLKLEYTKAGNLEAALAVDTILKEAMVKRGSSATSVPNQPNRLSKMTIEDFKSWLTTVEIVESRGEKTIFQFDGATMNSLRGSSPSPRVHKDVEIELGIIKVPFSTDLAVIRISESLNTAEVRYDGEPPVDAKITAKHQNK